MDEITIIGPKLTCNLPNYVLFLAGSPCLPYPKEANELLQTMEFSSPDPKIMHKAKLYGPVYNPVYGFPRATVLKLDGKIVGTLDRTKYVGSNIALGEITNDSQNEVFFYQYSTGSGGAMGLHVYSLIDGVWKRIFTDPRDKVNSNSNRFKSEYAGKMRLRYRNHSVGVCLFTSDICSFCSQHLYL